MKVKYGKSATVQSNSLSVRELIDLIVSNDVPPEATVRFSVTNGDVREPYFGTTMRIDVEWEEEQ